MYYKHAKITPGCHHLPPLCLKEQRKEETKLDKQGRVFSMREKMTSFRFFYIQSQNPSPKIMYKYTYHYSHPHSPRPCHAFSPVLPFLSTGLLVNTVQSLSRVQTKWAEAQRLFFHVLFGVGKVQSLTCYCSVAYLLNHMSKYFITIILRPIVLYRF